MTSYPISTREKARAMGAAGWKPTEITRQLARAGFDPVPNPSIVRWWLKGAVDYEAAMEHQCRNKARKNAAACGGRFLGRTRTPEFWSTRRDALIAAGLAPAVADAVIEFDRGGPLEAEDRVAMIDDEAADTAAVNLRKDGLSYTAISIVMARFHNVTLTDEEWRRRLRRAGVAPKRHGSAYHHQAATA